MFRQITASSSFPSIGRVAAFCFKRNHHRDNQGDQNEKFAVKCFFLGHNRNYLSIELAYFCS